LGRFWLGTGLALLVGAGALAEEGLERVASLVRTGDDRGALTQINLLPNHDRDSDALRYLEGRLLSNVPRRCVMIRCADGQALRRNAATAPMRDRYC
jgi:hypothetical protein